ncbi:MAG TPA: DoxX family protein [Gemmatimonadales bacterium]|nr:DoxX family protein [Gemmatimonadales bacterium]
MATTRRANIGLWIVQGVLTCLFFFTGALKLFAPLQMLQGPVAFPGWFYRFLGFAELCGALGLVLPGALRIQRALTPIAAVGLMLIVTGATVITLETGLGVAMALMPFVTTILTALVAYGRRDWLPAAWSGARSSAASSAAQGSAQ